MQVPQEMVTQFHNSYVEADIHVPTLEDLGAQLEEGGATFHTYLDQLIQGLQKEAKEKFKGWVTCSSTDNTDLAFKKVISGLIKITPREPQVTARNLVCFKDGSAHRAWHTRQQAKTLSRDCQATRWHTVQTRKPDH